MPYLLREDIRRLVIYIAQTRLLGREEIHTPAQLETVHSHTGQTIEGLKRERRRLFRTAYKSENATEVEQV